MTLHESELTVENHNLLAGFAEITRKDIIECYNDALMWGITHLEPGITCDHAVEEWLLEVALPYVKRLRDSRFRPFLVM
ncbi:hypothetical protein [Granulicella aggregans]|uniref:hypothetical protein n=1 Tax=Granulicella aggregans TaxID=474949 RepID=UPI0021DF4D2C|nr:hypothetical protein [Granulicella aggregans]